MIEEVYHMVVNIYDTANELEQQMSQTQEFQALKKSFDALKADTETFDLFKKFQQSQAQAQQKQMKGEKLSDEEIKNVQDLAKQVSQKDAVRALMEKEKQMDNMLQQLNDTITKPIQDLYKEALQ